MKRLVPVLDERQRVGVLREHIRKLLLCTDGSKNDGLEVHGVLAQEMIPHVDMFRT